ncbi:hypothetical protein OOZ63_20695 [Paucibacter sp. PLA-PC-4]|uniref:hypothetical protein n=1 Tax=Paucibacter sp. PLA-PC-4 TaxID=2993655 RepID=UPI00224AF421|nr:hypothetical protein [Paucibacter sp. PLA-PC-4]MCX2864251.1 hypothetical protein [Paucibacter sp. PLA-PC-4]
MIEADVKGAKLTLLTGARLRTVTITSKMAACAEVYTESMAAMAAPVRERRMMCAVIGCAWQDGG